MILTNIGTVKEILARHGFSFSKGLGQNFIINPEQKASAEDIKKLSDEVKKIVFEKKGVRLENEILFIES